MVLWSYECVVLLSRGVVKLGWVCSYVFVACCNYEVV